MKFCSKCGKEIAEDALVCPGCGCETENVEGSKTAKDKKRMSKKKIILTIICLVSLAAVIVAGLLVRNSIRIKQVKEDLAGNTFYLSELSYYSYTTKEYAFDFAANCTYSYYYSNVMDEEKSYEKDYEIEFKNGKVFLVFLADTLEVQYNDYGEIKQLYDINTDEIYD